MELRRCVCVHIASCGHGGTGVVGSVSVLCVRALLVPVARLLYNYVLITIDTSCPAGWSLAPNRRAQRARQVLVCQFARAHLTSLPLPAYP
ncbi:hypothetical protein TPAR_01238 [Tolypocladium paradoxum]|uniref:Uncharacterized protein n=1 Tax=Tolypocladium paradoxum TaxID=94208 RepID=A0A2S4L7Y7_9HYPO|nr:hypothetical protein TPAR_01238 [Tolypocladium paradoxum]